MTDVVGRGLVRETIGAGEGELRVRGLVREVVGAPGIGGNQLIVSGLVREAVVVPGIVAPTGARQYAVTVIS